MFINKCLDTGKAKNTELVRNKTKHQEIKVTNGERKKPD